MMIFYVIFGHLEMWTFITYFKILEVWEVTIIYPSKYDMQLVIYNSLPGNQRKTIVWVFLKSYL